MRKNFFVVVDFKGRRKAETLKGGSNGDTHWTVFVFILGDFFLSLLGRRSWEKAARGPEQMEWHQLWVNLKLIKLIFPKCSLGKMCWHRPANTFISPPPIKRKSSSAEPNSPSPGHFLHVNKLHPPFSGLRATLETRRRVPPPSAARAGIPRARGRPCAPPCSSSFPSMTVPKAASFSIMLLFLSWDSSCFSFVWTFICPFF